MCDQNLARSHLPLVVLRIVARQPLLQKIVRQTLASRARSGKQHDAVAFLFPTLQILYEQLKAIVVRVDRAHGQTVSAGNTPRRARIFKGTKTDAVAPGKSGRDLLTRKQKLCHARQHIALFQPVLHALPELLLHRIPALQKPIRLIEEKEGI